MDRREFLKMALAGMSLLALGINLPEQKELMPRQVGGPIKPGYLYTVGNGHPELFIPDKTGIVISRPVIWYSHGGTTWDIEK